MSAREAIAGWLTGRPQNPASLRYADEIIAALDAAGYSVVADGQARIDGRVVGLTAADPFEVIEQDGPMIRGRSDLWAAVTLTDPPPHEGDESNE